MKKVTVINAYGDKNIGDAAILTVALRFIREAYDNKCKISVLCEDTKSLSSFIDTSKKVVAFQLPYGYAIRGKKRTSYLTKLSRFIAIFANTYRIMLANKYFNISIPKTGFYSYIKELKDADIVIGMGGGYFTTNNKIKDYFGLLLSLLTVYVAKFFHKNIVFFPISFGPFASKHQENISLNVLKKTTTISRDRITLKEIKRLDKKNEINTFYAPDLALFFDTLPHTLENKIASKYIILTAREWFADPIKQNNYENALFHFVEQVNKEYDLKTIFIPMGRNPIEDDDHIVARRIEKKIKDKKIFQVYNPHSLKDLQKKLNGAKISICTRMHSSILSCTVGTPFIAIGYGHKTLGFVRSFDLEKWHIDIKDVNEENLLSKFREIQEPKNYRIFRDTLHEKMTDIQSYKEKIISTLKK